MIKRIAWNKGIDHLSDKAKASIGKATRERIANFGHPKGMLNKKHTDKVKKQISNTLKALIASGERVVYHPPKQIVNKPCIVCTKNIYGTPSRIKNKKFCSYKCMGFSKRIPRKKCIDCPKLLNIGNKQSIRCSNCRGKFYSGERSPGWKGGHNKCLDCGKTLCHDKKSTRCYTCHGLSVTAENSPYWKGGDKRIRVQIAKKAKYKKWRTDVFKRDNYTCQFCKARNGNGKKIVLQADHFPLTAAYIIHKYKITTIFQAYKCPILWDINNGRTLCLDCHKKTPTYAKNLKIQTSIPCRISKNP